MNSTPSTSSRVLELEAGIPADWVPKHGPPHVMKSPVMFDLARSGRFSSSRPNLANFQRPLSLQHLLATIIRLSPVNYDLRGLLAYALRMSGPV